MTDIQRTECDCTECQSYCRHLPGWFLPHEIDAAAALLDMTPAQFFREHLTVDCWIGDSVFTLRPRTTAEPGGDVSPFDPRGQCSFFKKGKCRIHAAKPHECASAKHDVKWPADFHKATADAWRPRQQRITDLLGREPEEPEGSLTDLFGMMFGILCSDAGESA